jgi:hypothetical protein
MATVRATSTSDGTDVFSVYDFISVVYQKNEAEARQVWGDLIARDVKQNTLPFMFYTVALRDSEAEPGVHTPVMTATGLQRLLLVLEDEVAAPFRQSGCIVIERVV